MTHQKRLPAPKHYPVEKKDKAYISTIKGSRGSENAIPAVLLLRDVLEYAENEKEAKEIIRNGDLYRNGERIREIKEGIGILDLVELPETEETYRVVRKGNYLDFIPLADDSKVAAKIVDKSVEGEKYIYRLHSGENYTTEDEFSTGNTLIFGSGVEELELEEGSRVLVVSGQHAGEVAEIEKINERGMDPDTGKVENGSEFETRLENLVAVGELKVSIE